MLLAPTIGSYPTKFHSHIAGSFFSAQSGQSASIPSLPSSQSFTGFGLPAPKACGAPWPNLGWSYSKVGPLGAAVSSNWASQGPSCRKAFHCGPKHAVSSTMKAIAADATQGSIWGVRLADSHCHLQEDKSKSGSELLRHEDKSKSGSELLRHISSPRLAVMGLCELDWEKVEELYHADPVKPGTTCVGDIVDVPPNQDLEDASLASILASKPSLSWMDRLRELLERYPNAAVGEFGLDRSSIIIGTKLGPTSCPPRIMLHSYGGSPEAVSQFTKLPKGLGKRIFFSFSSVINGKGSGKGREKLIKRIQAVPDDRLLIESDQIDAALIDSGLQEIVEVVAEAKGWTLDEATERTLFNFNTFFEGCLPSDLKV
eukprot:gene30450-35459_t